MEVPVVMTGSELTSSPICSDFAHPGEFMYSGGFVYELSLGPYQMRDGWVAV
jgi:hypothetical protein